MKKALIYFCALALLTLALMVWDNAQRPYDPESGHTGNLKNALYYCALFVLAELYLVSLTLKLFERKSLALKLLAIAGWLGITVLAFINSIHGGGVVAAHALWLLVVCISLACILIVQLFKKRN